MDKKKRVICLCIALVAIVIYAVLVVVGKIAIYTANLTIIRNGAIIQAIKAILAVIAIIPLLIELYFEETKMSIIVFCIIGCLILAVISVAKMII